METFKLEIVTPEGVIFSGDVRSAQFPGSEGELGVLPRHASLITLLKTGVIEIVDGDGSKDIVAINWGYLKIEENKVSVLADGAVHVYGSDQSAIAASLAKAKELISSMSSDTATYASTLARIESASR